jgi:hypothetical protein
VFRFEHFKGVEPNRVARELGAWARRQRMNLMFEIRREASKDVIYLVLEQAR